LYHQSEENKYNLNHPNTITISKKLYNLSGANIYSFEELVNEHDNFIIHQAAQKLKPYPCGEILPNPYNKVLIIAIYWIILGLYLVELKRFPQNLLTNIFLKV
jgi:hypothetical protein